MRGEAKLLYACELNSQHETGHFFAPHLFELRSLDQVKTEEFGPMLHVARYRADQLPQVIEAIRRTGFGLTLGVHSRLESVADHVFRALPVGNTYVNRNMIGAVVGVQPFRRPRSLRYGTKGRWTALPAALRDGAHAHNQHRGDRWERGAAVVKHSF